MQEVTDIPAVVAVGILVASLSFILVLPSDFERTSCSWQYHCGALFSPLVDDVLGAFNVLEIIFDSSPSPDSYLMICKLYADHGFSVDETKSLRKPYRNCSSLFGVNDTHFTDDSGMMITFQHDFQCDWLILSACHCKRFFPPKTFGCYNTLKVENDPKHALLIIWDFFIKERRSF